MGSIRIRSCFPQDVTVISNDFLDRFLPEANGDFLRVYLWLLRAVGDDAATITLGSVADRLNCTEADVRRALRYWQREGVLSVTQDEDGTITEIAFTGSEGRTDSREEPEEPPKSSDITSERMAELGEREDIRELFFIAQNYLGKPLSRSEMQKICFFYDGLHFSPDLIDYLIDYCVSRNHKSFYYIEKVALNWKEQGIRTVHEARVQAGSYHREYYDILKALGIDNHHPVDAEVKIMKKWLEKYHFSMDIIREACTRTVMNASKPSLNYADSILSRWNTNGVKTLEDIAALDAAHEQDLQAKAAAKKPSPSQGKTAPKKNAFTDFSDSTFDYSSIEKQLLDS